VIVICLIEENIFSVLALLGVLFKNTVSADTVLCAELFPEFVTDFTLK
jgi:hypothetical protein